VRAAFGGFDDGRLNCIPITPDWVHSERMYESRPEVLDDSRSFPAIEPTS